MSLMARSRDLCMYVRIYVSLDIGCSFSLFFFFAFSLAPVPDKFSLDFRDWMNYNDTRADKRMKLWNEATKE